MRYLYKIYYENNRSDFEKIYNKRISFDTTMRIDLNIKPIDQPHIYDLFYTPTNEMMSRVSEIYRISGKLNSLFDDLPPVAKDQFITECMVEELYNTNELEGVRSTKEEIARSVKEVKLNKNDKKRFKSMIKSYIALIRGETQLPTKPVDIRKIYDNITEGEIEVEELPDGNIFRKGVTHVLKKSGSGKVIHRGIIPEANIINEIEKMLNFLNEDNDVPLIIKAAIGHYFFGYVHPFYDGNGRTSRFISSIYLSKSLGEVSSISLSRGCNKYKMKYLDAFEITNSISNRGELNFFIDTFLSIILDALIEMYEELKEKGELLEIALKKLKKDKQVEGDNERKFLFILAQNHFFSFGDGVTVKELSETMDVSGATVRKLAKDLLEKSLIDQIGQRPAHFVIKEGYFEE